MRVLACRPGVLLPMQARAKAAAKPKPTPEPALGWDDTMSHACFRVLLPRMAVSLSVTVDAKVALKIKTSCVVKVRRSAAAKDAPAWSDPKHTLPPMQVSKMAVKAYGGLGNTPADGLSRSWDLTELGVTAPQLAYLIRKPLVVTGQCLSQPLHDLPIQDVVQLYVACHKLAPKPLIKELVARAVVNTYQVRLVTEVPWGYGEGPYASKRRALKKPPPLLPRPRVHPWRIFSGLRGGRPKPFQANVAITLNEGKVFQVGWVSSG